MDTELDSQYRNGDKSGSLSKRDGREVQPYGEPHPVDNNDEASKRQVATPGRNDGAQLPDPEVSAKAQRRQFSTECKLRILREADSYELGSGDLGVLLRREGLYSSHLTTWRRQRERGELKGLAPQKRGRKPIPANPLKIKVSELERENDQLRRRLEQAETVIDVQKKVSELLGMRPQDGENGGKS